MKKTGYACRDMKTFKSGFWFSCCLSLFSSCSSVPPAEIEDRSAPAVVIKPEVLPPPKKTLDYGSNLEKGPDYIVQVGDTLYAVAFRLGVDYRALAEVNGIEPPYIIRVGSALKTDLDAKENITSTAKGPSDDLSVPKIVGEDQSAKAVRPTSSIAATKKDGSISAATSSDESLRDKVLVEPWRWPAKGKVSRRYSEHKHKGIDLLGNRGDPIQAAASGIVVYAGTGVTGYGALLILKHNDTYLSAYGHNDTLLVREGDRVVSGQTIAKMGSSSADMVKLHFEIRRNGIPVDPLTLLPAS